MGEKRKKKRCRRKEGDEAKEGGWDTKHKHEGRLLGNQKQANLLPFFLETSSNRASSACLAFSFARRSS